MDLKSFAESKQTQQPQPQQQSNLKEADVRRAVKYFGNMSNDQLMRELSKHISAKKQAGKEAEIYGVLEQIKPFLNEEQRKRLEEIMRSFA